MRNIIVIFFSFSLLLAQGSVEQSVLGKVQEIFRREGGRLTFSTLYNSPEFSGEERKVLGRLYEIFFAIPAYLKSEQASGVIPTRKAIGQQFAISPYSVELLLKVMESDSRVPPLFERSPETGEIRSLNLDNIDLFLAQRGSRIKITGWEGEPLPEFSLQTLDGRLFSHESLKGSNALLYFWFTGCPPCKKIAPILAELSAAYRPRGFKFVGINADDVLELETSNASRQAYLSKEGIDFVNLNLNREVREKFGSINVYPTLFFVRKDGTIYRHYVNFQSRERLVETIETMSTMN